MFGGYCFHNLLENMPKHLHQCLVLFFCDHLDLFYWKLDLWVVFFSVGGFCLAIVLGHWDSQSPNCFFSLWRVRSNETSVFHNLKKGDRGLSFVFKPYKVLVLQAHRNPKSVLELLEFPF